VALADAAAAAASAALAAALGVIALQPHRGEASAASSASFS